jgi:hypothetical protein
VWDGVVSQKGPDTGSQPPRAHVGRARTATGSGRGNERRQDSPFRLGEIGRITLHQPVPSIHQVLRGPTSYHADHFSDRL